MKKLHILLAALLLCAASCQKVVDFDTTATEKQFVVNAVPSAGKQLFVNFSYTRFFLADAPDGVPGADMLVRVNGIDYRPSSIDANHNYFFPCTLQEDDSLDLILLVGDHPITAHTYVPRMPGVQSLISGIDTTQVFNLGLINFNLNDHPGYRDYYNITIQQRDSGCRYNPYFETYDTIDTTYNTFFLCFNPELTSPDVAATEALGGYFYTQMLFTDGRIDGQQYPANLMLMLLVDTNEIEPFIHQYTLNIESVTPNRYEYLKSVSTATSLTTLFAEPTQAYSNVEGALGIFAGNARLKFPLQMDTLPPGAFSAPPLPPAAQRQAQRLVKR